MSREVPALGNGADLEKQTSLLLCCFSMDIFWPFHPPARAGDLSSGKLNLQSSDFSRGKAFLAQGQADLQQCQSFPNPHVLLKHPKDLPTPADRSAPT